MSDQTPNPTEDTEESKPERIAKRIARSGVCSRRDAERMIEEGLVKLNGKVLDSPAVTVTDEDEIYVNGKPLPQKEKPRLWRLFKKRGLVTSHRDEQGRDTVFEHLPSYMPRVISVGRLDLNSEGLLLLTNDGELARYLELPATGWARRYRVRVHGRIDEAKLKQLEDGVTVDGINYGSIQAEVDVQKDSNAWMTVTLREGKNREIRRVMEHLGWPVTRLMRVSYGPFQLGNLAPGDCEEITGKVMKEQLAAFFKGDYSKVSEKKSVARGGTGRPKAPRTVFGKPAAPRRRQQGNNLNAVTDDTRTENGFENRTRPGNRARPAVARGEVSRGGPARENRENREDRNDRGARNDRDNRFDDRDNTNRPANKGRGRYAPGGKAGGERNSDGGKSFGGGRGKPSGNTGGNNRGSIADGKPGNRPAGRSGSKPAGNRPRSKKG
ncbi:pseudouridine synthase [Thalassospira lucentensis]|uniref:pseudouridine synthase n=1 Tax=Thalassospira lucentensis TaxID=168935 RepID=UPI002943B86C|nr:pseudouridine synthase [Thalassospira lucentensis]WOI09176.1 pseudouridine synthase [Thalassospira lucentensis]